MNAPIGNWQSPNGRASGSASHPLALYVTMTPSLPARRTAVWLCGACLLFGGPTLSLAGQRAEALAPQEPAGAEEAEEAPVEAEFVASTIFQGGTVALRLRSPLTLEGHYFGVEDNEIGVVGLAWTFTHRELRIVPGIGWAFGSENRPAPVITVRWSYETSAG
jgi:hypothetical protein